MTSLGGHWRLLKKREFVTRLRKNAKNHSRLLLLKTRNCHFLALGFRARGFMF